jgi:indolepyruvate ferredoxin oxidoreductase
VQLASLPEEIRGYGHVRERHVKAAQAKWQALLARYRGEGPPAQIIAMPHRAA